MSRSVRVVAGKKQIALPNGNVYDGQVDVTLTDEEFRKISAGFFPDTLIDQGEVIGSPGADVGLDSDTLTALESITVTDGGASLTVDAPLGTPVSVRLSDGTSPITTLPVSGPVTDTQIRAAPLPISGTITANLGTINGAATAAKQPAFGTAGTPSADILSVQGVGGGTGLPVSGSVSVSNLPVTQPVSGSVSVTNMIAAVETGLAKDGTDGSAPPVVLGSGTGIRGWLRSIYEKLTGSIAVTGTFWQATQPVSGTVTANAGTGPFPVNDNAGSLTIDAPVGTPAFVRLSDGSAAITTLPVSGTFWQATQPVSGTVTANPTRPATPAQTSVAASVSSVSLLAANAARLGATLYNDSASLCRVKLGATASATSFAVVLAALSGGVGGYFEVPYGYTGAIDAIWESATGNMRITELTA